MSKRIGKKKIFDLYKRLYGKYVDLHENSKVIESKKYFPFSSIDFVWKYSCCSDRKINVGFHFIDVSSRFNSFLFLSFT